MREEQKLAGIFAGAVLASLLAITPDVVVKILTLAKSIDLTNEALFKVRDSFAILNSAINIFIYTLLGKEFRKYLCPVGFIKRKAKHSFTQKS